VNDSDTIAAVCTGVGGAVSVIRISGAAALAVAGKIFQSRQALGHANARRLLLGKAFPDGGGPGEPSMAVYMPGPNSYTGEDVVELHAHGGACNSRRLLEAAARAGARQAAPGEFTFRAFCNGKMDLTQAEAVADLIAAGSQMSLRLAERQMDGALGRQIKTVRDQLVDILAECESRLDFPEEELDFLPPDAQAERLAALRAGLKALHDTRGDGVALRDGVTIVIAGRPNSGKSSLLNRLLGFDRAITAPLPGTTRDTLEEHSVLRGLPLKLVDTAGLRDSDDPTEQNGVARAVASIKRAQLVVWLLDASRADEPGPLEEHLGEHQKILTVWNKTDLVATPAELPDTPYPTARISTLTGTGMEEFLDLLERSVWDHPHAAEPEVAVSARHAELLKTAMTALDDATVHVLSQDWELAATGLRDAAAALGEIIGVGAGIDIYETIFSKFCIGK